jgi:hypothetical protein
MRLFNLKPNEKPQFGRFEASKIEFAAISAI